MGTESEERPPKVVCYRAGSKPGGYLLLASLPYLLLWQAWVVGSQGVLAGLELGTGITRWVERKVSGGLGLCDPWRWEQRGGGGHSKYPDTKMGVRSQDWI